MKWQIVVGVAANMLMPVSGGEACEYLHMGTPPEDNAEVPTALEYAAALKNLDMDAVKADMKALLADSQECWPADYGNYGPLMVRLAWHCSGSYRRSDGVGGCGGGRQRFEPERSWPDNTNLDKARALLYPLKRKYGNALSWGDLFILAGTTALRDAGAPIKQMCFGRVDNADGTLSQGLGPTAQQEKIAPCKVNGMCKEPLGVTTVGLIYVNPEGPVMEDGGKSNPDPALSAKDIRQTFVSMGHTDKNTVALIGAHALGKGHGACPTAPGLSPKDAYSQTPVAVPWAGECGTGKGADAMTAGFEGPWTSDPLAWDNEFFKSLLDNEWEKHVGPGGHWQWRIKGDKDSKIMRLTSDMALLHDEAYLAAVKEFAGDMGKFNEAFDEAWFDLTVTYGVDAWSKEAKCDAGELPKAAAARSTMRADDAVEAVEVADVGLHEDTLQDMTPVVLAVAMIGSVVYVVGRCRRGSQEGHEPLLSDA